MPEKLISLAFLWQDSVYRQVLPHSFLNIERAEGLVAQLVEHTLDKRKRRGSKPLKPKSLSQFNRIETKNPFFFSFFL